MVKNGFASFIGLAQEVSFGTQLAPTDFIEFNTESLAKEINRIIFLFKGHPRFFLALVDKWPKSYLLNVLAI